MIPERYRGMLPAYWYEIEMAERHLSVMEDEMLLREQKIDELSNQFVLPKATWSLWIWEWIYFRRQMSGNDTSRREAIRKKRWGNSPFRIPVLRDLANQHGRLLEIKEDFVSRGIEFQFSTDETVDQDSLQRNFEYIRPVHIRTMTVSFKSPDWNSGVEISERYSAISYPFQAFAGNDLYCGVPYDGPQIVTLPTPPAYFGGERIAQSYEWVLQDAFTFAGTIYAGGLETPATVIPVNQSVNYASGEQIGAAYSRTVQEGYRLSGTFDTGTEVT